MVPAVEEPGWGVLLPFACVAALQTCAVQTVLATASLQSYSLLPIAPEPAV